MPTINPLMPMFGSGLALIGYGLHGFIGAGITLIGYCVFVGIIDETYQ